VSASPSAARRCRNQRCIIRPSIKLSIASRWDEGVAQNWPDHWSTDQLMMLVGKQQNKDLIALDIIL
jgi:hypothetical protein